MPEASEPQFLTAEQVAERLHVSPRTVIKWARDGNIPEIRPSPRIRRYDWSAVVNALKSIDVERRTDR